MSAGDLTTLAKVKAYLGQEVSTDDTLLGQLITAASGWIVAYLNRNVLQGSYTETLDGTGTPKIVVPQFPITAVASITVDGVPLDLSKVVARRATLTRTDGGKFTRGMGNVVVTFTAGYAEVPQALDQACVELVAWRYSEKDRIGQASKSAGGMETVAYLTGPMPANVRTLLDSWRKVVPV